MSKDKTAALIPAMFCWQHPQRAAFSLRASPPPIITLVARLRIDQRSGYSRHINKVADLRQMRLAAPQEEGHEPSTSSPERYLRP
jgi:hypothetical protein